MGLRLVARYYDRMEAVVVSAALDAAGIPNWLENYNQIWIQPFHDIALHGFRLMVVDEDLAAALATIKEARRTRSFEGERLSKDHRLATTLLVFAATWFIPWYLFGIGIPYWFPLPRYKWIDVGAPDAKTAQTAE